MHRLKRQSRLKNDRAGEAMSKRLTLKQLKFIQIYIETGNATKAAMTAYRCKNENVAAVLGSENLRKPNIACEIEKYRKEGGLSIQKAINAINDGYDAEKKGAPDHNVRLRSADMTLKLANAYPSPTTRGAPQTLPPIPENGRGVLKASLR